MSDTSAFQNLSMETLVAQMADDFVERLERGEHPEVDEFAGRHPQFANEIRQVLSSLQLIRSSSLSEAALTTMLPSEPQVMGRLGDYRIVREIGRGGMGVVYEAVQISLGRRVALKVLPFAAAMDAKQLQRFHNEAQAAAGLQHQNIVPVYGVGCERGVHYYAMQLIDGLTLATMIRDLRQLAGLGAGEPDAAEAAPSELARQLASGTLVRVPMALANETAQHQTAALTTERSRGNAALFRTLAQLGVQAAEGLEHAQQLGVVHRDIKPANLLVDVRGNVWITDFGLAHCQNQGGLTLTGDLVGTLRYMSPEQALGQRVPVDQRSDLYSLGATLYELLTLEPAFGGRDRQALLRQIASEEPRPLRRVNPAIPAELETIVMKAMEINPAERYDTAKELADDLERYLKDEPIRAKRPTLMQLARKWARRHQAVVSTAGVATAVLVLVALAALAVSYAYVSREKDQKEIALREKDQALRQAQDNAQAKEANLQLARKAVDDIYEKLADRFAYLPQLQSLEEEFLQQALILYRLFAHQNSMDPGIRLGLARIYRRFGQMRTRLNQYQQAEEALMQAVALLESLVADYPSEPRYRFELATTHCKLDFVLGETKGTVQAEQALRRAVALLTELVAEHPDADYRKSLAGAHNSLGSRLHARPQEAEKAHELAITLCEQLEAEFPKRTTFRGELFRGHQLLGQVRAEAGRFQEAEKSYRQAIVLYEQRADTLNSSYYRELLPDVHFELAKVLHALDRLQQAEDEYRLAIGLYEKEVAEFPRAPHRWYKLYDSYTTLARFLLQTGRPTVALDVRRQALDHYAEAIAKFPDEVADHEGRPRLAISLAVLLQDSGQPQEVEQGYRQALAVSEKRAAQFPRIASHHLFAAYWHNALGTLATAAGRAPEAANAYRQAAAHYRAVLEVNGSHLAALNNLARLLANCPEAEVRDTKDAVQLAKRAVDLAPRTGHLWNTLGLAHCRAGDCKAAITALEKSMELYAGRTESERKESFSTFLLAMAHWQLGDKDAARRWHDQAVRWMEKYRGMEKDRPTDQELLRFRAEAGALLEL